MWRCTFSAATLALCCTPLVSANDCAIGINTDTISDAVEFVDAAPSYTFRLRTAPGTWVFLEGQWVCHRFTLDEWAEYGGIELVASFDYDLSSAWSGSVVIIYESGPNKGQGAVYSTGIQRSRSIEDAFGQDMHLINIWLSPCGTATSSIAPGDYVILFKTTTDAGKDLKPLEPDLTSFKILQAVSDGDDEPTGFVWPHEFGDPWFPADFYPVDLEPLYDNQPMRPAIRVRLLPHPLNSLTCTEGCPGDADGDGMVTLRDINLVLKHFDQPIETSCIKGDVNVDCEVNFFDLQIVVNNFGNRCG